MRRRGRKAPAAPTQPHAFLHLGLGLVTIVAKSRREVALYVSANDTNTIAMAGVHGTPGDMLQLAERLARIALKARGMRR